MIFINKKIGFYGTVNPNRSQETGVTRHLIKTIFILIVLLVFVLPLSAEDVQPTGTDDDASGMNDSAQYDSLQSLYTLYQPYISNMTAYEPIYFLIGTDPSKSKFQISLKYQIVNTPNEFIEKHQWIKGFYLAYTQTSFWDLSSDSAPFDDTSYKPEIFFLSPNIFFPTKKVMRLFLQTGLQHESNGQAGEYSRSTNLAYIKPIFIYYNEPHKIGFQMSLKTWFYFNNDERTNPDIGDYRGFFELGFKCGFAELLVVDNSFHWAEKGVSYKVDATYPLSKYIFKHVDMFVYMQYVNCLAEQIVDYQDRSETFRIGLAIVR